MEFKVLSIRAYNDFPVSWEILNDKTTLILTDLFEVNVNHEVDSKTISEVVHQLIVELFPEEITIH
jgi:hypothetical protein